MEARLGEPLLTCRQCGGVFRAPRWNREYRCASCLTPLAQARSRRALGVNAWAIAGLAALLFAGGIIQLAASRNATRQALREAAEGAAASYMPRRHEERLRQRLTWLNQDLRRDPRDPMLLTWLAESNIQMGVVLRQKNRRQSERYLKQGAEFARRMAEAEPITADFQHRLMDQVGAPDEMLWVYGGASACGRVDPLQRDPTACLMVDVDQTALFFGLTSGPADKPAIMAQPKPAPIVPGSSFLNVVQTVAPESRPGRSDMMAPPRGYPAGGAPSLFKFPPDHAIMPSVDFAKVDELRRKFAQDHTDWRTANNLGHILEFTANGASYIAGAPEPRRKREEYLQEAVRVYEQAAAAARTNARQAAFLQAASNVHTMLRDNEGAYRLLKQAAPLAPYAPILWRSVHNAALRESDVLAARQAWKNYQGWSLPRTRPRWY